MKNFSINHMKKTLLIASAVLFFVPSLAFAMDGWQTVTPPGTSGFTFNTISTVGNFVYVGTNKGVYKSSDRGETWVSALPAVNVISIAIGWTYTGNQYQVGLSSPVYLATNSGVYKGTIVGNTWTAVNSGLTDTTVKDIEIDQNLAIQGTVTTLYAATPSGVFRSINGGTSWTLQSNGLSGKVITKIVSDFGNKLLYAATTENSVYASPLFSATATDEEWSQVKAPGSTALNDIDMLNGLGQINWLATDTGILKSDTEGQNWIAKNQGLTVGKVLTVKSDYLDTNIVYAALPGAGVFRTTNEALGTPQWLPINKNLSDLSITDVVTNPADSAVVYALGTGVYKLELSNLTVDLTPPSSVTDLSVFSRAPSATVLHWTAPGNDGLFGRATSYDIRYATGTPITEANWASATKVIPQPTPYPSGTAESYTIVRNLPTDLDFYFAMKAGDGPFGQAPLNQSLLSNVAFSAGVIPPDTIAPKVTAFTVASTSSTFVVPIVSFTATDNVAVTGFLLTESSSTPLLANVNWTTTAPASYTFSTEGTKILYAWAKDAAGNVSSSMSATVTVILPVSFVAPTVTTSGISSISQTAATLNGSIGNTGGVNATVRGFAYGSTLQYGATTTETGSFGAGSFSMSISSLVCGTMYHARAYGTNSVGTGFGQDKTFTTLVCPVVDIVAPTVTSFVIPQTFIGLTIPITTFTATDNVLVTGYIVTENAVAPLSSASGWANTAPVSYTFSNQGTKILYAWAKDAAGNVSTSTKSQTISVTKKKPGAPKNPHGTALSVSQIEISWDIPLDTVDVAGYDIFRNSTTSTSIATANTLTYSDSGLSPSTEYVYYIRTVDASGDVSEFSDPVAVTTQTPPPPAPNGGGGGGGGGGVFVPTPPPVDIIISSSTVDTSKVPVVQNTTDLPVVARAHFSTPLYYGIRHEEVSLLQELLITEGFLPTGSANGYFGDLTLKAVKEFQCKAGLMCSGSDWGLVGPKTRIVLNAHVDAQSSIAVVSKPTTQIIANTSLSLEMLALGSRSENVRTLQRFLNGAGFTVAVSGPGSRGQESTYFGPATEKAVKAFQLARGIASSGNAGFGIVGAKTRLAIAASSGKSVAEIPAVKNNSGSNSNINQQANVLSALQNKGNTANTSTAQTTLVLPIITKPMDPGFKHPEVLALQKFLIAEGYLSPSELSGVYGETTIKAMQAFQSKYALVPTGEPLVTGYGLTGPKTRAAVNAIIKQKYSSAS